jgi:tetratricopeptide (TPR) repeat protein
MNQHTAKTTVLVTLLFVSIVSAPALADTVSVQAALDAWVRMWNTFDYREVDRLFLQSDAVTYFSSEREGRIEGIEAVREHYKGFGFVSGGSHPLTKLWLEDVRIQDHGSTATVTGIWYFQRTDGRLQKGPVSIFYVTEDSEHKIAHMNFSNYEPSQLPDGFQAISLLGEPLTSGTPSPTTLANLKRAEQTYQGDPGNIDNIVWYGRRMAYTGDYREAIRIFSEGIEKHPDEPRFYRHRGHRLISIREYEAAVRDFEKALSLVEGKDDIVEQDGIPNAMNRPISSLHSNIRYHLGLAYYLSGQLDQALNIYQADVAAADNDDQLAAATHWLYMTLRLLGREDEAQQVLEPISSEMDVIETQGYLNLCLFYKGAMGIEEILGGDDPSNQIGAGMLYGIANWYAYNGDQEKAEEYLRQIVAGNGWSSFGYIAAEADLAKLNR